MTRIRSGVSCLTDASPGDASEKSGVVLPPCSRTASSRVRVPCGAATVNSRVLSTPTSLPGCVMSMAGAAARPAATQTTPRREREDEDEAQEDAHGDHLLMWGR